MTPLQSSLLLCVAASLLATGCSDTTIATDEQPLEPTEPIARRDLSGCSPETSTACVTLSDGAPAETRYTLFNVLSAEDSGLYLVDGLGRFLNSWSTSGADGEPMPEPGHVLGTIEHPGPTTLPSLVDFRSPCVAILDWDGGAVWPNEAPPGAECGGELNPLQYGTTDEGRPSALAHHDLQVWNTPVYWTPEITESRGDGRVLFLAHADLTPEQSAAVGGMDVGEESIVEMAADGKTLLWEWLGADHIDELGFDADARAAITLFAGGLAPPDVPAPPGQGWLLLNAVSYLGPNRHCREPGSSECDERFHPDNVLVGSRQGALLFIVARHDHPDGDWSAGNVVWRLGPYFDDVTFGPISGQHHPHMIPFGLPGEGNILVFDNGSAAGFGRDASGALTSNLYDRGYSRILEVDPATREAVWSYEQPTAGADGTPRFYAFNLSSSQRLPGGNTFIDEGNSGRMFEVTRDGEIVWEFVSPFEPLITLQLPTGTLSVNVYRAYRVSPDWAPEG